MRVGAARAVAVGWVRERMRVDPSIEGALFSGSTVGLPDDAVLPVWSDVDVLLVRREPGAKVGKFVHRGVLLEVSTVTWEELGGPEEVLGSWVFAPMFRTDGVIADPSGKLAAVRERVAAGFADPVCVAARCAGVRRRIEDGLRAVGGSAPVAEQVLAWVFPTSLLAVWPAVAGLADPTVRRRYVRAERVLARFGLADRYAGLLDTLDGGGVDVERVRAHLAGLAVVFDEVSRLPREEFAFGADLSAAGRPVVFDGAAELIAAGRHREAMFWVLVTYARCHVVSGAVAPERERAFGAVLADLGVASSADRRRRADGLLAALPGWQAVVDAVAAEAVAG
ncbi:MULTISPECIES: hypothetical protein [unclassified Micromonospora]|uniref:hypothetical protein n=1 Tax=unclassified Micromonospora TaxID=2617518 RepID=UPI001C2228B9|nr:MULTISPECIES: hypothetical protein [unclassified Micromonospora]MBU8860957.1 hypothetical protein [Micromonospora sp. WMMB482]MDM4780500.1 hypothetical protein [Micromonospora sp. b486]